MIYSCQLPQRSYITQKHTCISDDNVVNVQCHFPPPISTGLLVYSFVYGVNHHYQTRSDTQQQYKLHYILCSILLDQNYFHMAWGNENFTVTDSAQQSIHETVVSVHKPQLSQHSQTSFFSRKHPGHLDIHNAIKNFPQSIPWIILPIPCELT